MGCISFCFYVKINGKVCKKKTMDNKSEVMHAK